MRTPHLDRIGLFLSSIVFSEKMTSYTVADMVAERSSSKLQVHRDHRSKKDSALWKAQTSETALADAVNRTVNMSTESGTEPTLSMSMPMLVANGNKVVFRGEDAELITAKVETAPLTSEGDEGTISHMPISKLGSEFEPGDETT